MALISFPLDLANIIEGKPYPAICFTHRDARTNEPGDRIFLPMPPGLEIADMMAYSTINLGIIGDIIADTITKAAAADNSIEGAVQGFGGLVGSLREKAKNANLAAAASIYARHRLGSEQYANVIDFANRQIIAPNTNSTFQGTNVRSYNFKFKMVARSRNESEVIKDIVAKFREYMYPLGNDTIQEYPGTWEISFVYGETDDARQKNRFVPEPYRCYLTNFTSAYNSGNNMWHDDGAPTEVDVAMNFQEIKALTRDHIKALNEQMQPETYSSDTSD
jgi:hypothetical protein